jgi:hypothetical protein
VARWRHARVCCRAVLALTALETDVALIGIFFVLFPAIITGLLALIFFAVQGERDDNQRYRERRR